MNMPRPHLPLNALRAFEASARHLSFTQAAIELCVTQAAVSHQVKALETRIGCRLFRRLPRGLALTDEGLALLPTLVDSFDRIGALIERIGEGKAREVLSLGAVSTFAVGWLVPRIWAFHAAAPDVDLRLFTNNNRVDIAAEGLDYAIRFGDGAWHATEAKWLMDAPLSPLCTPVIAARLSRPADLLRETLLRSYRAEEWNRWFAAAGIEAPPLRGPVFDSSLAMMSAAEQGLGIALAPPSMFASMLDAGTIVQPFPVTVGAGGYWLTWLKSRQPGPAMQEFSGWIEQEAASSASWESPSSAASG